MEHEMFHYSGEEQKMEVSEQNIATLVGYLQNTMQADVSVRKPAETFLESVEQNQGFPLLLLEVLNRPTTDANIQVVAAVFFKNVIKRHWCLRYQGETLSNISDSDKEVIRTHIVTLMLASQGKVQRVISEAISLIGRSDFPAKWPALLDTLIAEFGGDDLAKVHSCLVTAHSLFERYRYESKSTELWLEIKFVLDKFAAPLTTLFQRLSKLVTDPAASSALPDASLLSLWQSVLMCARIFYDLNAQDLPEFFEDHMAEWMPVFLELLKTDNEKLRAICARTLADDEPSVVEELRSEICDIVAMYAQKYDEEFAAYLPGFVDIIWHLLTSTSTEQKYDSLISNAVSFLASVAGRAQYKQLFEAEGVLAQICEKIILPNMHIRQSDQEMFEDNPEEYMRRDIEGSDVDTRRRACTDLVQSLCKQFEPQVIANFSQYITHLLAEYGQNPVQQWPRKDVCIYLVMALVSRGQTSRHGATKTTDLVNVNDFYTQHILPELAASDVNAQPVLKADAIKFLITFRSQLQSQQILQALTPLVGLLGAESVVVRSYAAHAFERLMLVKQAGTQTPVLSDSQLGELAPQLLPALLACLFREGTELSDYVIKAVMRLIQSLKHHVVPHTQMILEKLAEKLAEVAKNPSKPHFNHYLFESYCVLIRQVHQSMGAGTSSVIGEFENALFPPFTQILQQDVVEFMPYVFQILAMMLDLRDKGSGMPGPYQELFPFLLMPALWERTGNVPALVMLLRSYLRVAAATIVSNQQLNPLLGVFQRLIALKSQDHYGFQLMDGIVHFVDWAPLAEPMRKVLLVCFNRLQQLKTAKYVKGLIGMLCLLVIKVGAVEFVQMLDAIQAGMFVMVLEKIIIPDVAKLNSNRDKKIAVVALTNLLTQAPAHCTHSDTRVELWPALLGCVMALFELPEDATTDEDQVGELEERDGYNAAFSQLAYGAKNLAADEDPTGVDNARAHFRKQLLALRATDADRFNKYTQQLDARAQEFLRACAQ